MALTPPNNELETPCASSQPRNAEDVAAEGKCPPITTSQLSMAFVYYSVQLQKTALAKLEAQVTALAARTQEGHEQNESMKAEISSLSHDRSSYEKLLTEHQDATRQFTSSNIEEIHAGLQKTCADTTSQISAANANIKALELVQKQMSEKFELQQERINDLARQDQTAQKQDDLVQAIHQLLNSCNTMICTKTRNGSDTQMKRKCQGFQERAQRLREELLNFTPESKRTLVYPSSVVPDRQIDDSMKYFDPADHFDTPRDLSSSSTVTIPSEPDLPDNSNLRKGEAYLRLYDKYRRTYRVQKPKSEKKFIRRFLSRMDQNQARLTQQRLLARFPEMVHKKSRSVRIGSRGALEFIQLNNLTWPDVAEAIAFMTGDELMNMST